MQRIAEASRLAQESADLGLQVGLLVTMVVWQLHSGELREARVNIERVLELTHDTPNLGASMVGFGTFVFATFYRGAIRLAAGELAEARSDFDRAIELAQAAGDLEVVAMALGFYVLVGWFGGDTRIGVPQAQRAVELAEKIGSPLARGQAYGFLGIAHVHREEWDAGIAALQHELAIAHEHRTLLFVEAGTLAMLARAYLGRGDHALARTTAEQALAAARQRGSRLFEADALLSLAFVLLRSDGLAARATIEAALLDAERLIAETGARSRAPWVHVHRAELAQLSGDAASADRELRTALERYTEIGAVTHAERVRRLLGVETAAMIST